MRDWTRHEREEFFVFLGIFALVMVVLTSAVWVPGLLRFLGLIA